MGKPIKAIIVDDEPGAIANLSLLLQTYPRIEVAATVTNALLAVDLIHEHQPDVVFLDIQMPEKTGFEIARELLEAGDAPAIIFATGFDKFAIEAIRHAAFDFLVKPVNPEELKQTVSRLEHALLIKDGQKYLFPIPLLNIRKLERFLS